LSALPAHASAPAAGTAGGSASTVALLRVDSGLRAAVPPDERPFAERVLIVPRCELGQGEWSPDMLVGDGPHPFAALVLRGLLTQEVMLGERRSAILLGPGDLFRPWRAADTCLPCESRWMAAGDAAIALLDERFLAGTRKWPGLSAVVYDRLAEQLQVGAVRAAISALPRVEERILALFWHLADRWGVVRPQGVVVELALTHAMIGHLVGAQRPTVSLALHALTEAGMLRRGPTGSWTLSHDTLATLAVDAAHGADNGGAPGARPLPRDPPAVAVAPAHAAR
jgi:CRP/FNR family transcriptional regulator, cyclic AMP receptor protein